MTLTGKINGAVAKVCLASVLAGATAWVESCSIREDLESVAPYTDSSDVRRYKELKKSEGILKKMVAEQRYGFTPEEFDSFPEEASAELAKSLQDKKERWGYVSRAQGKVQQEMAEARGSREYKLAVAQEEEIEKIVEPVSELGDKFFMIGLVGLFGCTLVGGIIEEFY